MSESLSHPYAKKPKLYECIGRKEYSDFKETPRHSRLQIMKSFFTHSQIDICSLRNLAGLHGRINPYGPYSIAACLSGGATQVEEKITNVYLNLKYFPSRFESIIRKKCSSTTLNEMAKNGVCPTEQLPFTICQCDGDVRTKLRSQFKEAETSLVLQQMENEENEKLRIERESNMSILSLLKAKKKRMSYTLAESYGDPLKKYVESLQKHLSGPLFIEPTPESIPTNSQLANSNPPKNNRLDEYQSPLHRLLQSAEPGKNGLAYVSEVLSADFVFEKYQPESAPFNGSIPPLLPQLSQPADVNYYKTIAKCASQESTSQGNPANSQFDGLPNNQPTAEFSLSFSSFLQCSEPTKKGFTEELDTNTYQETSSQTNLTPSISATQAERSLACLMDYVHEQNMKMTPVEKQFLHEHTFAVPALPKRFQPADNHESNRTELCKSLLLHETPSHNSDRAILAGGDFTFLVDYVNKLNTERSQGASRLPQVDPFVPISKLALPQRAQAERKYTGTSNCAHEKDDCILLSNSSS
ncbi:hypothetical protein GCK72_025069 [Caenorhabditis remanei]|uniref:Uncharacterized protein n=1 Tax=Caenorhabditis remanei TaxID=31234 RepID=A0A6A5G1Q6_CAERE|nr:hypothetical protein GCK72_025069 [Caenorhabditis remanei]KAF1748602.1 hypothetical protein GCK72_025069 [Caenorhabditis remanei]